MPGLDYQWIGNAGFWEAYLLPFWCLIAELLLLLVLLLLCSLVDWIGRRRDGRKLFWAPGADSVAGVGSCRHRHVRCCKLPSLGPSLFFSPAFHLLNFKLSKEYIIFTSKEYGKNNSMGHMDKGVLGYNQHNIADYFLALISASY